jgi:hypothetical protein
VDLALTKDGRKSFKRQGKWGHGFVPLDAKAKEAKAKGSPIAAKRVERLYGKAAGKKKVGTTLESKTGGSERVQRLESARNIVLKDATKAQRVKPSQKEASKGGGRTARATQPWEKITDANKVTRNGKRYVLTNFHGKQQLTEWVGQNADVETRSTSRLSNLSAIDAGRMTTAEIRRALKTGGIPKHVRTVLNQALAKKVKSK